MSTVAEAPIEVNPEVVPETPEPAKEQPKEQPKEAQKKGSATEDVRIVLPGTQPPEPIKEQPKTEVPEAKKDAPVDPAKDQKPMSENARQQFARLEKERNDAQTKADALEARLKAAEASAAPTAELSKRAEEAEKRVQQLTSELRTVSLERDPEFIDRYNKPREGRVAQLALIAKDAGVDQDFEQAFRTGDQDKLSDIRESLPIAKRAAFDAHLTAIANIDYERQEALKDSDKTVKQMEEGRMKIREQEMQQYTQQNVQAADSTIEEIFEMVPGIKEDSELRDVLKQHLHAAAGATEEAASWDTKKILKGVGMAIVQDKILRVQNSVIEGQKGEIDTLTKERDDLKKQLEERDQFIKTRAGGYPRSDHSSSTNGNTEPKLTSATSDVRIRLPEGRYV